MIVSVPPAGCANLLVPGLNPKPVPGVADPVQEAHGEVLAAAQDVVAVQKGSIAEANAEEGPRGVVAVQVVAAVVVVVLVEAANPTRRFNCPKKTRPTWKNATDAISVSLPAWSTTRTVRIQRPSSSGMLQLEEEAAAAPIRPQIVVATVPVPRYPSAPSVVLDPARRSPSDVDPFHDEPAQEVRFRFDVGPVQEARLRCVVDPAQEVLFPFDVDRALVAHFP